jgi:C4-dicarboxylate-specific signal transduction histidine kinase
LAPVQEPARPHRVAPKGKPRSTIHGWRGRRLAFQNAAMPKSIAQPQQAARRLPRARSTTAAPAPDHGATSASESKRAQLSAVKRQQEMTHLARVAMLGGLSGAIAHELNQPLTAILSNADAGRLLIDRGRLDPSELRDILGDIAAEGRRAGEIIRRLRVLMQPGQHPHQRLDTNEVVLETLQRLSVELETRHVVLRTALAPAALAIDADRVQLQQVLINLVINACDAMQDLAPAARQMLIRTALAPCGGVCVSVVDQGTGVPPHLLGRMFDSFFTTKANGMGLGLSVCLSIVRAHDGRLWAENNPGGGVAFHFVLPSANKELP